MCENEQVLAYREVDLSEEQRGEINKLLAKWDTVQGRLKDVEFLGQQAVVPAINELRYAGRMLVSALSRTHVPGQMSLDDSIVSAKQYLKNADHDITDAAIYHFQGRVDDINRAFGAKAVLEKTPSYQDVIDLVKKAKELVIESRTNLLERDRIYQELNLIVVELGKTFSNLEQTELFFAIDLAKSKRKIRRLSIALLVSILGLIAALATIAAS